MADRIIRQAAVAGWEAHEMLDAFNEVISSLHRSGRQMFEGELKKIAVAVVDAAANVPVSQDGLRDHRALVEATFQYMKRIQAK
jgi:hypothetical protein